VVAGGADDAGGADSEEWVGAEELVDTDVVAIFAGLTANEACDDVDEDEDEGPGEPPAGDEVGLVAGDDEGEAADEDEGEAAGTEEEEAAGTDDEDRIEVVVVACEVVDGKAEETTGTALPSKMSFWAPFSNP